MSRPLLTSAMIALLVAWTTSCGGTQAARQSASSPSEAAQKNDGDGDHDGTGFRDSDDQDVLAFGHEAPASVRSEVAAVLKRYYGAAAHMDGRQACAALYSLLVEFIAESVDTSRSESCAVQIRPLLRARHAKFVVHLNRLTLLGVRIEGDRGFAVLGLGRGPERYIEVHADGTTWRLNEIIDSGFL